MELSNSRLIALQCPFRFDQEHNKGLRQPLTEPLIRGRLGHAILEKYIDHLKRVRRKRDIEALTEISYDLCMTHEGYDGDPVDYTPNALCKAVIQVCRSYGYQFTLLKKALAHYSELIIIVDRQGNAWTDQTWRAAGYRGYDHEAHCLPDPPFDVVTGILDYTCRVKLNKATIVDTKLGFQAADFNEATLSQQGLLYSFQLFCLWPELEHCDFVLHAPKYGDLNKSSHHYSRATATEQALARIERGFNVLDICHETGQYPYRDENVATCQYCPCSGICPGNAETVDVVMQRPVYRWNSKAYNLIPTTRKAK